MWHCKVGKVVSYRQNNVSKYKENYNNISHAKGLLRDHVVEAPSISIKFDISGLLLSYVRTHIL